jgi:hypothetical protein
VIVTAELQQHSIEMASAGVGTACGKEDTSKDLNPLYNHLHREF